MGKINPLRRNKIDHVQDSDFPVILGKFSRKDFELWVCLTTEGRITMRWWRWHEDEKKFLAMNDGGLTLEPSELRSLVNLLGTVDTLIGQREQL